MRFLKPVLIVGAIAWFGMVVTMGFWYLAPSDNFLGLATSNPSGSSGHAQGSEGQRRHLMLVEATRIYKESGVPIAQGIANGTALAPVPFLNQELERQGAKWRVRSTDGLDVLILEIS